MSNVTFRKQRRQTFNQNPSLVCTMILKLVKLCLRVSFTNNELSLYLFKVLAIFGAGCEDSALCTRVLLGIEPQATARLTNYFGSTLLYHGSDCTRETPFYVAIVGICSSFLCHR